MKHLKKLQFLGRQFFDSLAALELKCFRIDLSFADPESRMRRIRVMQQVDRGAAGHGCVRAVRATPKGLVT